MTKATLKQKTAIKNATEAVKNGYNVSLKDIMIKSGYSKATAHNPDKNLTSKPSWIKAMEGIDYAKQLKQVEQLGDTDINSDKDNALKAKDMLFKLGDKYPKGETKIIGIFNKIESISEPDDK